jgi:predicted RNA binding protein YcfA (HicA-like mRNA interferase family)
VDFPAIQARRLLRILQRKPLSYRVMAQNGSHRKLESDCYPSINFAWHDGVDIKPGAVKRLLCGRVGLSETEALAVIRGRRDEWPKSK